MSRPQTADEHAMNRPLDLVRPLLRVRQIREFTNEPVERPLLDAIAQAARWSGSSNNTQPWRFLVLDDVPMLRAIAEAGVPQARPLLTATAAIAIAMPDPSTRQLTDAFDDGRVAERILIAANLVGLAAGICRVIPAAEALIRDRLRTPDDRRVGTIVAIGHPTASALQPKSAPGTARLPTEALIYHGSWRRG